MKDKEINDIDLVEEEKVETAVEVAETSEEEVSASIKEEEVSIPTEEMSTLTEETEDSSVQEKEEEISLPVEVEEESSPQEEEEEDTSFEEEAEISGAEEEPAPAEEKPKVSMKLGFLNKKNILLIICLLILVFVWQLSKSREHTERRIDVFRIVSADITRIEFRQPADTLIVAFEQNRWRITHPQDAPVNQDQLDRFFENYLSITTSSIPVSESIERQSFYNVDEENALQIVLFGRNNRPLSRVFYGRNFTNQRIAYIRQEHSNQIYQIENIMFFINPVFSAWEGEDVYEMGDEEWLWDEGIDFEHQDVMMPTIMIGD
ncbi:MAG: DUF4340 domain-containing protein [Candidatus Cloacimonetes bacterium]|nr:DUF4340 domain-containing protein [Candidatus Cloacimonadota bacterium]